VKDDYNKSPVLEPGKTYYFSITYVFSNGSFVTPTATATIPFFPGETEPSAPAVTSPALFVSSDGSALNFSWTALPDSTVSYNGTIFSYFSYYKLVASATNPNPVYPDDGYIYFTSDLGSSGWSASADAAGLVSGQTYYFSVTYVFGSGKFVSNTVQYTVP
jgi:YHS domain-containing protein